MSRRYTYLAHCLEVVSPREIWGSMKIPLSRNFCRNKKNHFNYQS
jgi:hypothetical protein